MQKQKTFSSRQPSFAQPPNQGPPALLAPKPLAISRFTTKKLKRPRVIYVPVEEFQRNESENALDAAFEAEKERRGRHWSTAEDSVLIAAMERVSARCGVEWIEM